MFTKEQIDEIIRRIKQESIKDTELPSTSTLSTRDVIPIVQDGISKITTVREFADLMTEIGANNFKGAYDTIYDLFAKYPNPEDRDYAWVWNGNYDIQTKKIYTTYLTKINPDGITYSWYNTGIIASAVIIDDDFDKNSSNGLQNSLITRRFETLENTVFPATMTLSISNVTVNTSFRLSWIVKDGSTTISNTDFTRIIISSTGGSNVILTDNNAHVSNYTVNYLRDSAYTVTIYFIDGRSVTRNITVSTTFRGFRYNGTIDPDTQITEATILHFGTEAIATSKAATITYTLSNKKAVYVYPASYGVLSTITDGNGFNITSSFTHSSISVNGIPCYAYVQIDASTVNNYQIKFN